ncbi:MAG: hypothetical protein JXA30_13645 [Deltaproteobacteria bacterium]|nr:hypothetical protein [Deltaproteobacteria bacterium]
MKSAETTLDAVVGDQRSSEKREVLDFPARLLIDLPLETTLVLRVPAVAEDVVWTTRTLEEPRKISKSIVFDREEVLALIVASEAERTWPRDLVDWCWMKRECPDFFIDMATALCGAKPSDDRCWKVERILEWLDVDLVSITVSERFETENQSVARAA